MFHPRRKARRLAVQAIYQWQLTGQNIDELAGQFVDDIKSKKIDAEYFLTIIHQVVEKSVNIDKRLLDVSDRPIMEIDPVERAILRLGACELIYHEDIPYRVIIDEAVELAKKFGADQSHKYINGILDKVAFSVRKVSTNQPTEL